MAGDNSNGGGLKCFADCMLGRLARWLRLVGVDTLYEREIEDSELLRRCRVEDRTLLTRDTDLAARARDVRVLFVESEVGSEQLMQVLRHFAIPLRQDRIFSRCTHCNNPVREIPRAEVEGKVPPYVFRTGPRFTYCSNCDKVYWRGTHRKRFLEQLSARSG